MNCRRTASLFALFLSVALPAQNKWSGEIGFDAGSNFFLSPQSKNTHNLGNISGKLGYEGEKFSFGLEATGKYRHLIVGQVGQNYKNGQDESKELKIDRFESSLIETTEINSATKVDFGWKATEKDSFNAFYSFEYDNVKPNTYTFESFPLENDLVNYSVSCSKEDNFNRIHNFGISYTRTFEKPDRQLFADIQAEIGNSYENADCLDGNGIGKKLEEGTDPETIVKYIRANLTDSLRYRIQPYSGNKDFKWNAVFTEPEFAGVENLTLDFSFGGHRNSLEEHFQGSTLINHEWRDSTSYRENFRFRTLRITPAVRVRYSIDWYSLDFEYSPEYYAYKLDSDERIGDVSVGSVAHQIKMANTFTPWKGHEFNLGFSREEERPEYIQICWFARDGQYSDEKYRGNPDLKNSITTKTNLSYTYSRKRFVANFNSGYTYQPRKIVKTYEYEMIEDQECRVYTWINGGNSHEFNEDLKLAWLGKRFKAELSGNYTYYRGFSHKGTETNSSEFSFSANAEYYLKKWTFSAGGGYQSEVKRTFVGRSAIPDCSLKVSKIFGKHICLYLEAKAILDRDLSITTESEDKTETRVETYRNNNRIFVLGFKYVFK